MYQINHKKYRKQAGFTLIEIMIVVGIIAILAAFAFPSYQESIRKSRRADAKIALNEIATLQEQYFIQKNQYTDVLTNGVDGLGYGTSSPEGFYTMSVQFPNLNAICSTARNCFQILATATGLQASDTDCKRIYFRSTGQEIAYKADNTRNDDKCWK